jgi:hypothetical protein
VSSWVPKGPFVIRVYYRTRKAYYVHLTPSGRRRVLAGWRGAERFERERDGLWVVITVRWHGNPIVEPLNDSD